MSASEEMTQGQRCESDSEEMFGDISSDSEQFTQGQRCESDSEEDSSDNEQEEDLDTGGLDTDEVDGPYYSTYIGYYRRIRLEYWTDSNSLMIVHQTGLHDATVASVTLADYSQMLENVAKTDYIIEQINQGVPILFKYSFKEGTTITIDSKYPGILLSSPASQPLKAHNNIFLHWYEWAHLLRLDLSRRIPKLHTLNITSLRPCAV